MQGFLQQRRRDGKWTQLFCRLKEGSLLFYREVLDDRPVVNFSLKDYVLSSLGEEECEGQKFVFKLAKPGVSEQILAAEDDQQLQKWLKAFKEHNIQIDSRSTKDIEDEEPIINLGSKLGNSGQNLLFFEPELENLSEYINGAHAKNDAVTNETEDEILKLDNTSSVEVNRMESGTTEIVKPHSETASIKKALDPSVSRLCSTASQDSGISSPQINGSELHRDFLQQDENRNKDDKSWPQFEEDPILGETDNLIIESPEQSASKQDGNQALEYQSDPRFKEDLSLDNTGNLTTKSSDLSSSKQHETPIQFKKDHSLVGTGDSTFKSSDLSHSKENELLRTEELLSDNQNLQKGNTTVEGRRPTNNATPKEKKLPEEGLISFETRLIQSDTPWKRFSISEDENNKESVEEYVPKNVKPLDKSTLNFFEKLDEHKHKTSPKLNTTLKKSASPQQTTISSPPSVKTQTATQKTAEVKSEVEVPDVASDYSTSQKKSALPQQKAISSPPWVKTQTTMQKTVEVKVEVLVPNAATDNITSQIPSQDVELNTSVLNTNKEPVTAEEELSSCKDAMRSAKSIFQRLETIDFSTNYKKNTLKSQKSHMEVGSYFRSSAGTRVPLLSRAKSEPALYQPDEVVSSWSGRYADQSEEKTVLKGATNPFLAHCRLKQKQVAEAKMAEKEKELAKKIEELKTQMEEEASGKQKQTFRILKIGSYAQAVPLRRSDALPRRLAEEEKKHQECVKGLREMREEIKRLALVLEYANGSSKY